MAAQQHGIEPSGVMNRYVSASSMAVSGVVDGNRSTFDSKNVVVLDGMLESKIKFRTNHFGEGLLIEYELLSLTDLSDHIYAQDQTLSTFGFSKDETEKDPNYKPFSVTGLVTDAIKGIGAFLKDMFTFDASKITEGLMDFGGFMKAISFASTAYLKTLLNPFQKGSNAEAAKLAYESKFDEIMGGGSSGADITPTGNGKTEELKTVTDQFTRGQEQGTTFIQDFSQQSDVSQQNGDVIIGADLSADDSDPTETVLGRVVRPGGFSDVRLKEDIKLLRKSPSDINIYEFKYIGEEGKYEGVMAQEVPWASSIADNGFLWVDYTKLDVEFIKLS